MNRVPTEYLLVDFGVAEPRFFDVLLGLRFAGNLRSSSSEEARSLSPWFFTARCVTSLLHNQKSLPELLHFGYYCQNHSRRASRPLPHKDP